MNIKPDSAMSRDKKSIVFDVDGTLSESRSIIDQEMARLFSALLIIKKVAIITGGAFADIEKQILSQVSLSEAQKKNLTLLPTNGGGLWIYDRKWQEVTSHKLSPAEKEKIITAVKEVDKADLELCSNKSHGIEIQDRDSSITYSALGDQAPIELKLAWDPDFKKRIALQKSLKKKLPEFEVKIGGTTSIDVTPKGMDKAYGIKVLLDYFNLKKEDILFLGDAVYEHGNDYPVFLAGIDTVKVSNPTETKLIINKILLAK